MFNREIAATVAMAQVVGSPLGTTMNRGFSTIARTGVGVYTLDYEPGSTGAAQASAELCTSVNSLTAGLYATHEYTSDTRLTVKLFDAAGSAADGAFDVIVQRVTNHEP
jgi:hypothetical protein